MTVMIIVMMCACAEATPVTGLSAVEASFRVSPVGCLVLLAALHGDHRTIELTTVHVVDRIFSISLVNKILK